MPFPFAIYIPSKIDKEGIMETAQGNLKTGTQSKQPTVHEYDSHLHH